MAGRLSALARRPFEAPVDIASLATFRIVFGALMVVASGRFLVRGWVHEEYEVPKYFFHYWGFGWVKPWPAPGMTVHYALMALSAFLVMIGWRSRLSTAAFGVLFTYAHIVDKTNYLNHYYLVSCLSLVLTFLPLDRAASVRVWRRPEERWDTVPGWALWLARFQVACVYFFGGVAKLKSDWLFHAQPLTIWLGANTDFPVLGPLFREKWFAFGFSWAGGFFDLTIVGWMLWRRSRPLAYVAVIVFHAMTGRLFQLGMFPWIMSGVALIFFDPSWSRRALERLAVLAPRSEPLREGAAPLPRWGRALALLYVAWQVLVPLRHWLYPGNLLWTEQGFRFAWNVMLIEKSGAVEVSIVERDTGRRSLVDARSYLTPYQVRMMSTQPDMILELAHIVADDYAQRGRPVAVYVEAEVALNGRRSAQLVDSTVDLSKVPDGLGPKTWLLPAPADPPQF